MNPAVEQEARDAIEDLGLITDDPAPTTRRPIAARAVAVEHAQGTDRVKTPPDRLSAALSAAPVSGWLAPLVAKHWRSDRPAAP
jgi:hypothetical protein